MRNFGFADYDEVGHVGTNGKMSEIAAAMGLTSLESLRRSSSPPTGAITRPIARRSRGSTAWS